jgi:hypothetical protein
LLQQNIAGREKIAKEASDAVHSRKNIARELIKDKKVK